MRGHLETIRVEPLDVESAGLPGRLGSGLQYHRFHLKSCDVFGIVAFRPDPRGIVLHGMSDRQYLAAYLEDLFQFLTPGDVREKVLERRVIQVPDEWLPKA